MKLTTNILQIIIFSLLFNLLTGCVSTIPQDLTASTIVVMKKYKLTDLVGNSISKSMIESKFILVKLSTKIDLINYTEKNSYTLGVNGYFCEKPDTPIFLSGPYIEGMSRFTRKINLPQQRIDTNVLTNTDEVYTYYVIVPFNFSKDIEIYGRPEREGAVFYEKYDLSSIPRNICLNLRGGAIMFGFKSNIVIVPTNNITKVANKTLQSDP